MMHNNKNKIFFWAFVPVWCALVVWNWLTPPQQFSEAENRYLKVFPVYTSTRLLEGDFMEDMNVYLSDQFAGRPAWVAGHSLLEYAAGKRELNGVYLGSDALLGDVLPPDAALTEANAVGVAAFAQNTGLPTYIMLVPAATSIQPQSLPRFAEGWDERAYIADVYANLPNTVTPVDIADALWQHRDEYIYYRTDHHWTSYGAFLAYERLAAAMNLASLQQGDFTIRTASDDFWGTFHSKTGFPLVGRDTIEIYESGRATAFEIFDGRETTTRDSIYFDEYLGKKDKYSYLFGQVQPAVTVRTDAGTGKKLLLFKDSYAHCLAPMLFSQFDEITMLDLRFLNPQQLGELIDTDDFDGALFLYSTDVFSHQPCASKLAETMA